MWTLRAVITASIFTVLWLTIPEGKAADTPKGVSATGSIDGFEAKFVDVKGVRTRYYEVGQGNDEAMVLIHGGGAPLLGMASANTWTPVLNSLASRYHVYAPDKLGSGLTNLPEDPDDLTIAGEVQHIFDFVQAMGLKKFHLVGQSRGGGLVFLFAVQHPELLHTLVIVNSSTASPSAGDDRRLRWERIFAICPQEPATEKWLCQYKTLAYDPDSVSDAFVDSSLYMMSLPSAEKRLKLMTPERKERNYILTSEMNHEAYHRILTERVLQMPVLLYWAKNDPSVLPVQAYSLFNIIAETNPRTRMLFTNKAGHFHYMEQPEEFSHNVISFIEYWKSKR